LSVCSACFVVLAAGCWSSRPGRGGRSERWSGLTA